MTYLQVQHKVRDYASWKSVFDKFIDTRRAGGEKSYLIMHPDDDPNNLVLLFEWDNAKRAHEFFKSPELKKAMQQAGVTEAPEVHVLEEVARGKVQ
jgi:quinol monooxygenase YgiN